MRKMFSKKQLEELIAIVVESKDWELNGDVSIGGDLVVTGDSTLGDVDLADGKVAKIFEDIVDKDGHKRFIEDNLTMETITGVTFSYNKWSLSGTHLMCVIAGKIDSGTSLSSTRICGLNVPSWIIDKIIAISGNRILSGSVSPLTSNVVSLGTLYFIVNKDNDNTISIISSYSAQTSDVWFRFNFDLLIDSEE